MLPLFFFLACKPDTSDTGTADTSAARDTADTADSADTACAEPSSGLPAACACAAPTLEVGGGDAAFEAMTDGVSMTMVHGPQGGWHVAASIRLGNLSPIVALHYTIDAGSVRVSDNRYRVQVLPEGTCGGWYPSMYGYLNVENLVNGEADTPPELLGGSELLLTVEAMDTEGRTATGTLRATAALDPIDVGAGR
jgi:hypothetical protein